MNEAPMARPNQVRKSEIISALSLALDLTEGQPMGHCVNCCLLGMRVAQELRLSESDANDLYFATLLKDTGCSSNAARMYEIFGGDERKAKREVKTQDWTRITFEGLNYLLRNVRPGRPPHERMMAIAQVALQRDQQAKEFTDIRCERGAQIALQLGFSNKTAQAIRHLDEHWDGKGYPEGLRGEDIPLLSRIMLVCQTMEVFTPLNGVMDALDVLRERRSSWFDPELVRVIESLEKDAQLWTSLQDGSALERVTALQPSEDERPADDETIDSICEAFAGVIDAKSPYTHEHSQRVTRVAVAIGSAMGLDDKNLTVLRRAGLLHDIGKLSVPNSILDKPGKLSATEWETVRLHPYYTQRILERINGFQHLAFIASTHHEKLNGTGYYRNLRATQLPMESRALTVADIFDAISSARAYRAASPIDQVFEIMKRDVPHALDASCFEALKVVASNISELVPANQNSGD
jgi:HD-GYP domain-containing protein (c-di-GMP phosphodiesterase class II)